MGKFGVIFFFFFFFFFFCHRISYIYCTHELAPGLSRFIRAYENNGATVRVGINVIEYPSELALVSYNMCV